MNAKPWLRLVVAATMTAGAALSQAQTTDEYTCPRTRAEVRDECISWMKQHRWDEASSNWIRKSDGKPVTNLPEGVSTRDQIRKERDEFMSKFKWNSALSRWEPIGGTPRMVSKMSRAEVRAETTAFMRTHVWNEDAGRYVDKRTN